jgi:hypothetical protein
MTPEMQKKRDDLAVKYSSQEVSEFESKRQHDVVSRAFIAGYDAGIAESKVLLDEAEKLATHVYEQHGHNFSTSGKMAKAFLEALKKFRGEA